MVVDANLTEKLEPFACRKYPSNFVRFRDGKQVIACDYPFYEYGAPNLTVGGADENLDQKSLGGSQCIPMKNESTQ